MICKDRREAAGVVKNWRFLAVGYLLPVAVNINSIILRFRGSTKRLFIMNFVYSI